MKATPSEIEKILEVLADSPRRLAHAIAEVEDSRLQFKPNERAWSANDVLAHIRSCADVWGGSIESMLAEDDPTLPDVHPRQWIKQTNYPELDFRKSFKTFTSQRAKLLKALKKLSFEDWSRSCMIEGRKHTICSQVRRMAKHEMGHCEQIESMLRQSSI